MAKNMEFHRVGTGIIKSELSVSLIKSAADVLFIPDTVTNRNSRTCNLL